MKNLLSQLSKLPSQFNQTDAIVTLCKHNLCISVLTIHWLEEICVAS